MDQFQKSAQYTQLQRRRQAVKRELEVLREQKKAQLQQLDKKTSKVAASKQNWDTSQFGHRASRKAPLEQCMPGAMANPPSAPRDKYHRKIYELKQLEKSVREIEHQESNLLMELQYTNRRLWALEAELSDSLRRRTPVDPYYYGLTKSPKERANMPNWPLESGRKVSGPMVSVSLQRSWSQDSGYWEGTPPPVGPPVIHGHVYSHEIVHPLPRPEPRQWNHTMNANGRVPYHTFSTGTFGLTDRRVDDRGMQPRNIVAPPHNGAFSSWHTAQTPVHFERSLYLGNNLYLPALDHHGHPVNEQFIFPGPQQPPGNFYPIASPELPDGAMQPRSIAAPLYYRAHSPWQSAPRAVHFESSVHHENFPHLPALDYYGHNVIAEGVFPHSNRPASNVHPTPAPQAPQPKNERPARPRRATMAKQDDVSKAGVAPKSFESRDRIRPDDEVKTRFENMEQNIGVMRLRRCYSSSMVDEIRLELSGTH